MCTTNDDHIMYGSCDIKQDMSYWKNSWRYYHFKHEYHKWKSYDVWFVRYSLGPSFALLHPPLSRPLTTQRIKILKKWKKHLEISSFYTSVPKIMIIGYTVPEIWCVLGVTIIFHFDPFFTLSPTNSLKNQNIKKMKKAPGDIIILY